MKIILLNKTCEYHTFLFATELIFCNNAKSNGKNPIGFLSREPRAMLTSRLAYNTSSLHRSIVSGVRGVNIYIYSARALEMDPDIL